MSVAGPSIDRSSSPSTDPPQLPTPIPSSSGHEQIIMSNDIRRATIPSPVDAGMRVGFPSRSHTLPERATARRQEPPITPLSPAQPLSGNQMPAAPPLPQTMPENPPEQSALQHHTTRGRLLAFFGLGTNPELRERKALMSLIWNLGFNGAQITAIITLLIYSSVHSSPQLPDVNEWKACSKPLGLWNSVWTVKLGFDCVILLWGHQRERASRAINPDTEARAGTSHPGVGPSGIVRLDRPPPPRGTNQTSGGQLQNNNGRNNPNLPHSPLYARLSVLLSMLSFIWFITSNVLIYSSLDSCRLAAPHIWWLTFAILALTYLMLLELLLLGLIVFVIGPIVYLIWNVFLMCIGQHPLQNPHQIKPEIGKLSKAAVEKIPLVLYIPAPEDQEPPPISKPSPAHTYPPTPPKPKQPRRRFFFLRKKKVGEPGAKEKGKGGSGSGDSWEDNWEKGEYPFVRLENNRAACAICLMDFDEPKRIGANLEKDNKDGSTKSKDTSNEASQQQEELKLEDAGEGPQPLRLLACGHVFHKTCLDPWLTGVSGRCPVCQRPVETEDTGAKKRRNART